MLVLDLPRNLQRRRAGVKDDGFAIVDQRSRKRPDAPLFFRMGLQALVYRRFAQNRVREHRPAVGTQYQSALVQFVQVIADSHRRTAEPAR